MPAFSTQSQQKLQTCHLALQQVARKAIRLYDFTVLHGHRGEALQNRLFSEGKSTLRWPESKHNKTPSQAVDIAPYPIDWGESPDDAARQVAVGRFYYQAGLVFGIAADLGIALRWGGDWDRDQDFYDQKFNDLVHFELVSLPKF